eukprot:CAMPEP_0195514778 /NCGR_PEP_ID=MMETSP0794_2-20130614/6062_1 /TAXON_ID=515487 /ORGANISM="Stephanopyxis turris, Strain CCMP 815" /LENGTH=876 /DNA_ID=CAMNT_0040643093 /DNA_START=103 /DNA_END=2733 /DNA_ORIENTATION=-
MASSSASYENFAPRSSTQRDRLARIAQLTAGPEAQAASSSSSRANSKDEDISFLIQAMSPNSLYNYKLGGARNNSSKEENKDEDDATEETTLFDDPEDEEEEEEDAYSSFLFHVSSTPTSSNDPATAAQHRSILRESRQISHQTTTSLQKCISASSCLQSHLSSATNLSGIILKRHSELLHHSGELSSACERLQQEEAVLSKHASDIGAPLQHYDSVDEMGVKVGVLFKEGGRVVVRGLAKVKVDSSEYVDLLDRIDDAMAFFGGDGGLSEGGKEYAKRSRVLHEAAIFLLKEAVVDRLKQTTRDIMSALSIPQKSLPADKLEASLIYTRFHGISSRSNSLLAILQKRASGEQKNMNSGGGFKYRELQEQCQSTYCTSRERLLKTSVRAHMDTLRNQHGLVGMTRLASVFLMRLCTIETALYLDFFGDNEPANQPTKQPQPPTSPANNKSSSTLDDEPFQQMLGSLCSFFHRTVRRGVVVLQDLDLLCQIVSVLREERATANANSNTRATARVISGVIEDAQERLIFCTQRLLQKEVILFRPTSQDLDYPNKLMGNNTADSNTAITTNTTDVGANTEGEDDAVQAQLRVYEAWFPPMRSVLRVLSKIFRVVEPRVFEDIALQAVQSCTKCLKEGSMTILQKQGLLHSDLFLVKHLLILREQLSPFDIQLRAVERQLDFSEAGKAVTRFLANQNRRIFSMSTENALVTLLREGVSVHEQSVDSKRDLEDALRSACNDFIEHASTTLAGPLVLFIQECKSGASSTTTTAVLKSQRFLSGDAVTSVLADTKAAMLKELGPLKMQMGVYLDSVPTQGILLKPVVRKITRHLDDAKRFVADTKDGQNGWDAPVREQVKLLMFDIETLVKEAGKIKLLPMSP